MTSYDLSLFYIRRTGRQERHFSFHHTWEILFAIRRLAYGNQQRSAVHVLPGLGCDVDSLASYLPLYVLTVSRFAVGLLLVKQLKGTQSGRWMSPDCNTLRIVVFIKTRERTRRGSGITGTM